MKLLEFQWNRLSGNLKQTLLFETGNKADLQYMISVHDKYAR